jgi:hypothetical protein
MTDGVRALRLRPTAPAHRDDVAASIGERAFAQGGDDREDVQRRVRDPAQDRDRGKRDDRGDERGCAEAEHGRSAEQIAEIVDDAACDQRVAGFHRDEHERCDDDAAGDERERATRCRGAEDVEQSRPAVASLDGGDERGDHRASRDPERKDGEHRSRFVLHVVVGVVHENVIAEDIDREVRRGRGEA